MSNQRYFNFPIQLLSGFLNDSKTCLDQISDYAIYAHSLKMEYGDELERFKSSLNYFNIRVEDIESCILNGKEIHDTCNQKSPKVGLRLEIFWDYYKNPKTEFQKACLLGYLAIKSILQNKTYCKIDNKFWLARMDGRAKSVSDLSELSPDIKRLTNEYQTRKIKSELKDNWNLITYSRYTRGFYVSFKMELEKLIYEAEKRRKSTRAKQSKFEEKIALERVRKRLSRES